LKLSEDKKILILSDPKHSDYLMNPETLEVISRNTDSLNLVDEYEGNQLYIMTGPYVYGHVQFKGEEERFNFHQAF